MLYNPPPRKGKRTEKKTKGKKKEIALFHFDLCSREPEMASLAG